MKNIADIRKDYASHTLDPDDCLAHPVAQFSRWLDDAIAADVPEPTAMLVSTVSPEGRPAARVVLLDCARGLVTEGRWIGTSLLAQASPGVPAP